MAEKGEQKTAPREYVVLKRTGPIECEVRGTAMATAAARAIDEIRGDDGGRWVAVPMRNWHEEDLTSEQKTITRRQRIHPGQTSIEEFVDRTKEPVRA